MAPQGAVDEAGVRQQIDRLAHAIRAMDLNGLKAIYTPDVVSCDVQAPVRCVGLEGKLENWVAASAAFRRPLGYDIRDLTIAMSGDVAFAHGLGRLSGTLKNGNRSDGFWVRFTACFRKTGDNWLIAHDHASAPLHLGSGSAVLDLAS